MAKDLNLALKKDVLESLQKGTTNEILIEGSRWWKKRLMDLDTGRFKDFTVARVSSGSSDKIEYDIESIESRGNDFVIIVNTSKQSYEDVEDSDYDGSEVPEYFENDERIVEDVIDEITESTDETQETVEDIVMDDIPATVETPVIAESDDVIEQTYVKPVEETTQKVFTDKKKKIEEIKEKLSEKNEEPGKTNVKELVMNILNQFCELKDVYVVSMPNVTIRNNGQIFGCKKKLIADRDSDVRFDFVKREFVKYPYTLDSAFSLQIMFYLNSLLKNNYVFINRNACGFKEGDNGNLIFVVTAVAKKKYFFSKK